MSGVVFLLHINYGIHPLVVIGVLVMTVQLWCWVQAAQRVEYVAGHRAGAKGYTGKAGGLPCRSAPSA